MMTSTASLLSSLMARLGQPGTRSLSAVSATSLTRMASSARSVAQLYLSNTWFLSWVSFSGYRGASCSQASQVLVCRKERQIEERLIQLLCKCAPVPVDWKKYQLIANQAVMCETWRVVMSSNKWFYLNMYRFKSFCGIFQKFLYN